jgi:hypothetical protein
MPKIGTDGGYRLPAEINPPDSICVTVSVPNDLGHVLAFWGALSELGYWWNWERDAQKRGRDAAAVWRERIAQARNSIYGDCEEGSVQLRQNPSNFCQLQQSFDGGISWQLAFDFSLCRARPDRITEQNFYNETLNTYNTVIEQYDGSVTSVAPNLVYTGDENADNARDVAICYAIHQLVAWACEIEIKRRNTDALMGGIISTVLAVVASLVGAGIILATAGTGTAVGFAIGSAIAGIGASLWSALSTEVLTSETARENVACCLYNALKGQTPTASLFADGLNDCSFGFGTPEAQLAGAITAVLSEDDVHATFIKYAHENFRYAELGLIDCPCPETWEQEFDFTISNGGWSPNQYCSGNNAAVYASGTGWQNATDIRNENCMLRSSWRIADIGINISTGVANITRIEIEYDSVRGSGASFIQAFMTPTLLGPTSPITMILNTSPLPLPNGIKTEIWEGNVPMDRKRFRVRVWASETMPNGNCTIRRVRVFGTGVNPFL